MLSRYPRITVLLIGALFLRALVPAGFMPDSDSLVKVCSAGGGGLQTIWIDPATGAWVDVEHDTIDSACSWAIAPLDDALPPLPDHPFAGLAPGYSSTALTQRRTNPPGGLLPPVRAPPLH